MAERAGNIADHLQVTWFEDLSPRRDLAVEWYDLEGRCEAEIFQTWFWNRALLRLAGSDRRPRIVAGLKVDRIVALALLFPSKSKDCWVVNEIGDPRFFGLNSEYNAPLMCRSLNREERIHIFLGIFDLLGRDCKIKMNAVLDDWNGADMRERLRISVWRERSAPIVDIDRISGGSVFAATGVRAQRMRHALRSYDDLEVSVARRGKVALCYLREMIGLHTVYWRSRGSPGAFSDPEIIGFHEDLVRSPTAQANAELFRVTSSGATIGVLYNLRFGRRYYAYQSGLLYRPGNRFRPGVLAHALFIDQIARLGAETYDFLAGDFRYKKEFANRARTLNWLDVRSL